MSGKCDICDEWGCVEANHNKPNLPHSDWKGCAMWLVSAFILCCLAAFVLTMFSGCCAPPQTVTRTEYIDVPIYRTDTVTAYLLPDSSFWGSDTVVTIQFKDRTFKYWIHDTLKVKYTDTVSQTITVEKKIETPFMSKLGIASIGFLFAVGLFAVVKIWKPF